MKKRGVLAIVLAVALVFQISAFSATGVFAGELSGDDGIPAASPSIAAPAEEPAATPTEETTPAQQEAEPAAPIEKEEPAAPAEEPTAPEQEPAQTPAPAAEEQQPAEAQPAAADTALSTPAADPEETPIATPAAAEITVNFHFYAYDTNAEYTVVKDVSRTVKSGGKTTNIAATTANGYVTKTSVKTEEHNYEFARTWAFDTAEGEAVAFPLSLTYEQAEARADGEASIDVNLYARYNEYGLNTVVHITNILYNTGNSVNGKAVAYENTYNLSGKAGSKGASGFFSQVGGSGRTAGGFGAEYKFLNAFVLADEQSGPVYWETAADGPTVTRIAFADYNNITVTLSNGETRTFDNCSDLYISPVYKRTVEWYLIYNYIDNISTGSGSWSNLDFVTSFSHTYTDPSVKTPVSHYQFVNWKNDETGDTYNAGETHIYDGATQPKGSTKTVNIYAYWQPSVTVNWHTPDGGLDQNAPNSGSIESFDPATAIEAYSYTPADIQHEVTDEEGNVQTVTFIFDGWYDKDGNKVEETADYTAPGITKEPVERSVVDLYPHYTRAITVTKAWDDEDNQDGLRAESVSVDLLAGEEVIGSAVLSEENAWTCTFENLAAFDEDGKVIEYTVAESQIPESYMASVSSAVADGVQTFTITNSHTPEVRDITISKVWNDNNDQYRQRPASVTIELLANGNAAERMQLTADSDWTGTFSGLDKYSEGEEIVYTIREAAIPNYSGVVAGNAEDGFTVTNTSTYVPPVDPDDTPDTPNPPVVPGITTPDDPAGPGTSTPPAGPATTGTTTTAAPAAPAAPASTINSDPAPRTNPAPVTITDPAPPQTPGTAYWALINLICAILTVLISLVLLVLYFTRRKNDSEENEYQDAQTGMQMSEEEKTERKKKGIFRLLSILPAIAGVVLFLLTENMHNPMRFIDEWTIWMAVILLANVILAVLSKKRKDEEESEQQTAGQTA